MDDRKAPTTETEKASGDGTTRGFVTLCAAVACLWLLCTLAIYLLLPDWQTRGTAGDSFGAVNALFSGLAFAGVIYALNLQRKELGYQRDEMLATRKVYEAQLAEMHAMREVQSQPLPIPEIQMLHIERPRLFYSPPEDKHSAQSRYTVGVSLRNPTPHPALGINVRCSIEVMDGERSLTATDSFVAVLAPGGEIDDSASRPDFLFAGDTAGRLFDSLRQSDPRKLPVLVVMLLFKNVVGGHFRLVQTFRVYATRVTSSIFVYGIPVSQALKRVISMNSPRYANSRGLETTPTGTSSFRG
jgi:hypothetical protein